MIGRRHRLILVLVVAALLGGCEREARSFKGRTSANASTRSRACPRNPYAGNAWGVGQGKRLLHAVQLRRLPRQRRRRHGPGADGRRWIYGSDDASVFETIAQRPPERHAGVRLAHHRIADLDAGRVRQSMSGTAADRRAARPRRSHALQHARELAAGAPAARRAERSRRVMARRRALWACCAAMAAAAAAASAGCAGPHHVFDPAGGPARDIAALGWLLFAVCTVVYVLVIAALAWALVRRRTEARRLGRDRPAPHARDRRGDHRLDHDHRRPHRRQRGHRARPDLADGSGRDHRRRRRPSVVVGLPVSATSARTSSCHSPNELHVPARPARDDQDDVARRHSQLLGAEPARQARPHSGPGHQHVDPGRSARCVSRPVRRVLRPRAREDGVRGRRRDDAEVQGVDRSPARERAASRPTSRNGAAATCSSARRAPPATPSAAPRRPRASAPISPTSAAA